MTDLLIVCDKHYYKKYALPLLHSYETHSPGVFEKFHIFTVNFTLNSDDYSYNTDFEDKEFKERYNPTKMVMDAGALGVKIQEEIRQRHGINLATAEKHRKFEFIELLNDDLRTGKFLARPQSRFEDDANLVQWDRINVNHLKISDRYHTDIGDAVLYAWRECKHFLSEKPEEKITYDANPDDYMLKFEEEEARKMEERLAGDDGMGVDYGDMELMEQDLEGYEFD